MAPKTALLIDCSTIEVETAQAVAKDAAVTVVIYNMARRGQQKVTANFALRKGELNEAKADAIVKALSDVLPK